MEENFLLVWRSLTVFYLEVAKLARNRMVEKLLADICALIPENGNVAGLPRIRRDALQNFSPPMWGCCRGCVRAIQHRRHSSPATALKSCAIFWMHPSPGGRCSTLPIES